jgi:hypothetical protein
MTPSMRTSAVSCSRITQRGDQMRFAIYALVILDCAISVFARNAATCQTPATESRLDAEVPQTPRRSWVVPLETLDQLVPL